MAKSMRNIGIITAGGDCGGLNGVVRGAANFAHRNGMGAYIIPHGYAGLYNLVDLDRIVHLDENRTDNVNSSFAGSEAGHSRVKIAKVDNPHKYERILDGLRKFSIDGLVISGGDDTGGVMVDLAENGIPCVHAPKTMDLDLQTYSVGGDSAINKIAHFVEEIKTTGKTHNRIMIVEVFGRYTGHTAFRGGVGADADAVLIPEIGVDFDILYAHMKRTYMRRILNSDVRAGTYTIVVAEGIKDAKGDLISQEDTKDSFGHIRLGGAGKYVRRKLEEQLKKDPEFPEFLKRHGMFVSGLYELPEVREVVPGHLVRSGSTSAFDVNFGKQIGGAAVMLLLEGKTGVTVMDVDGAKIRYIPTKDAIRQRRVDMQMVSFYEAMNVCFGRVPQLYVPEFEEYQGEIIYRHI
ncbi:MAG TPA: 6-phosphofructokinase [Synergistaceae bacterium]|nr:6-phosphofructokinase [Synergistaceae bacterium]HPQ36603.1 6-phosphofructokinase [Synergistaceae bacterium]